MKKYLIISIIILIALIVGFIIFMDHSENSCGTDVVCFENALINCEAGIEGKSVTKDNTANIYTEMIWEQKIIGKEDDLCKTYRKATTKVKMNNENRKQIDEYYIYYNLGDISKIVKSEEIN
jgi:hypothetical protein